MVEILAGFFKIFLRALLVNEHSWTIETEQNVTMSDAVLFFKRAQ